MKILDTKKAKKRHETAATDEQERREFEEWLKTANSTAPLTADELKGIWGLWDGFTTPPADLKKLADSLGKQMGINP